LGFGEVDDFAHGFAVLDIGEEGCGGKVPFANDFFALFDISVFSHQQSPSPYLRIVSCSIAAQILLRVHDEPGSFTEVLFEEWVTGYQGCTIIATLDYEVDGR
jgi:hypothetical protein